MSKANPVILVTGALGQLGTELIKTLRAYHGTERVIAADVRTPQPGCDFEGPFLHLNVLDKEALQDIVLGHGVTEIYHLAALLSARGEAEPLMAWNLNVDSLLNVLEVARQFNLRVFWPSSIAVFGPNAPRYKCPQETILTPTTIYGISKSTGEQLCQWYKIKYGVDVRSLRYPGLISSSAAPGGGTTDYAVEIFHEVLKNGSYECFLDADTNLPMLYMDDAVRGTIQLMQTQKEQLRYVAYNITGTSFTPKQLAGAISQQFAPVNITYAPDHRQRIADSWPKSIDDRAAQEDWNWQPHFDLDAMTAEMLKNLKGDRFSQLETESYADAIYSL
ncbi:MAG: NAD-dependent epimerase/dehydratase family protein [Mucilaginibacter sp.]|nr:NAD-dependent epimerase/dehydratase family protein [Mucilaginibacter sp.]